MAAPSLPGRAISHLGQKFGNVAGLALIVAGTVMVALSMVRFIRIERSIDSEDVRADTGAKLDIALALLLILLGVSMFLYLSHAFVYA